MRVQPFVILGTTQQAVLQKCLNLDLDSWVSTWFVGKICSTIKIRPENQTSIGINDSQRLTVENSAGETLALCSVDKTGREHIGSLLLGDHGENYDSVPEEGVFHTVIRESLLDLLKRILQSDTKLGIKGTDKEKVENFLPFATREILQMTIELNGTPFFLWLPVIQLLPRFFSPPTSMSLESPEVLEIKESLANQRLTARIGLGEAELTIDALANLKIGDVIRLDKTLEEPLTLEIDCSSLRFAGYLGQQNGILNFQIDDLLANEMDIRN